MTHRISDTYAADPIKFRAGSLPARQTIIEFEHPQNGWICLTAQQLWKVGGGNKRVVDVT